jgi:serine protease Do
MTAHLLLMPLSLLLGGLPAADEAVKAEPPAPLSAPRAEADETGPFGPAVKKVLPAIVRIQGVGAGQRIGGFGTGITISPEGHILTVYSAILTDDPERGVQPKVTLADGRVVPARMHFRSRDLEAAIIKIDPKDIPGGPPAAGLPHLAPGDSDALRPGHWLMLVGNVFNLAQGDEAPSVNLGVLSAVVPHLEASGRIGAGEVRYKGKAFITDANNNPGGYGGAAFTPEGDWVGLTGRIVTGTATNTQINYVVPVNELKEFIAAGLARKPGAGDIDFKPATRAVEKPVVAGYHGIHLFRQAGQLPAPYVERLDRKSPAKAAGLREDDLIQYVNGKLVQTCDQFDAVIGKVPAGAEVKLGVVRGRDKKEEKEFTFTLQEAKK